MSLSRKIVAVCAAGISLIAVYSLIAFAFGPAQGQSPGSGSGVISSDGANNIAIGTSTTQANVKLLVVGSSTSAGDFAIKVLKSSGAPIFYVQNDGSVSIATTTIGNGNALTVDGTIYSSNNFSGSVTANNVTPGVFDGASGGNYAFNGWLGVATTTQVGLPAALSVYGNSYFTGKMSLGTTTVPSFSDALTIDGNVKILGTGNLTITSGNLSVDSGGSSYYKGALAVGTSSNPGVFSVGSGSSKLLMVSNTGVGIMKINSPFYALDVSGTVNAVTFIGNIGAGNVTAGSFGSGTFTFPSLLGVGSAVAPSSTLTVTGDIYASGNVAVGGIFLGNGTVPIGAVLPWLKSLGGTPALPSNFAECNGQTINDAASPYNGIAIPDLNGNNYFLRGNSTSSATGGIALTTTTTSGISANAGASVFVTAVNSNNLPPYYNVVWVMRIK